MGDKLKFDVEGYEKFAENEKELKKSELMENSLNKEELKRKQKSLCLQTMFRTIDENMEVIKVYGNREYIKYFEKATNKYTLLDDEGIVIYTHN